MVSNKYSEPFTFDKLDHDLGGGYRPRERRGIEQGRSEAGADSGGQSAWPGERTAADKKSINFF